MIFCYFGRKTEYGNALEIINETDFITRALFSELPDIRKKATANHLKDAAWSAFSVFVTPSPSFLDYPVRMQKTLGKNNAQSLFGVHQIPSTNPIRNRLGPVPPKTNYLLLASIGGGIQTMVKHVGFRLFGTEHYRYRKNGV